MRCHCSHEFNDHSDKHTGARSCDFCPCQLFTEPLLEASADTVPGQAFVAMKARAELAEFALAQRAADLMAAPTMLARALHMTDVDVMVFAAEVGEAQAATGGKMLLERGPNVLAAVEKMWERDELGLRTKWLDHAKRALDLLSHK